MLGAIPKHKGTEKMQADIKHRISQLRQQVHKTEPLRDKDMVEIHE